MVKVLQITGSTGFVGQNLINYLKSIDGFQFLLTGRQQLAQLEIKDSVNVLIHLAGKAHDFKNISTPEEYYQVNTELTKKVFDELKYDIYDNKYTYHNYNGIYSNELQRVIYEINKCEDDLFKLNGVEYNNFVDDIYTLEEYAQRQINLDYIEIVGK